jgi:hypothetical protein
MDPTAHGRGSTISAAEKWRGQPARSVRHSAVGHRWPIFDYQHPFAPDGVRVGDRDLQGGFHEGGFGIQLLQIGSNRLHGCRLSRVDLADDKDVCRSGIGFAGVVQGFMSWPTCIRKHHVQVWNEERQVVVPAIPDQNIGFLFGPSEDLLIVDTSEHRDAGFDQRLILLAFLQGAVVPIQVRQFAEPLHRLSGQVAIGHGMANRHDSVAEIAEYTTNVSGSGAFAGAGTDSAKSDHRFGRPQLRVARTQQAEVGPGSQGN